MVDLSYQRPVFDVASIDKKLFTVRDHAGVEYTLEVSLSLGLMALLYKHGTELERGELDESAFDELLDGMLQMFERHNDGFDLKKLRRTFDIPELITLLAYVFGLMRGGATAATEAATAPTGGKATTTKPARSKKSTGAANSAPASTSHKHSDQPAVKVTQDWPPQPE